MLRCQNCGHYIHYPQPVCNRCGSADLTPEEVSGRGSLYSYCEVWQASHPYFRDKLPYIIGVIDLEEEPGVRLPTGIVDCVLDDLQCGMAMEVVVPAVTPTLTLPFFRLWDRAVRAQEVAAVGVGYSTTGRNTGLTSFELARQATTAALADAGMTTDDLDGVTLLWGTAGPARPGIDMVEPMSFAEAMGIGPLNWYGTSGPAYIGPALDAISAIRAGFAHNVLTLRIINQRLSTSAEIASGGQRPRRSRHQADGVHGPLWVQRRRHHPVHRRDARPTAHGHVRDDRGAVRRARRRPALPRLDER